MEYGSTAQDPTQAKGVCNLLCEGHCLLAPRQSLIRIAKEPQRPGGKALAHHPSVVPIEERSSVVLLGGVERHTLGVVHERRGYRAQEKQRRPQGTVRRHEHRSVLDLLRQGQELLSQCVCRLVLSAYLIIIPQSTEDWKQLLRIVQVLADLLSVG